MGRKGSSGMTSVSNVSSSGIGPTIKGGPKTGDFIQTFPDRWVSEKQTISAAMLAGPDRHPVSTRDSKFEIVKGEYKGKTVYRLYEQHMNRRHGMNGAVT